LKEKQEIKSFFDKTSLGHFSEPGEGKDFGNGSPVWILT